MEKIKVLLGYVLANASKIGAAIAFFTSVTVGDAATQIITGLAAAITGVLIIIDFIGQRFLQKLPSPNQ